MAWMSVAVVLGASRWGTGSVGCGRWAVLGGFLCWFVVGGCWGRWCCRWCFRWFRVCPLVRVSWRPVSALGVAVRVFLGVAVRHSWLRAWWVLLCVLAASGGPAVPLAGCWVPVVWVCVCCVCGAGGACALVCGARLWGSCRWRLWGCVVCTLGRVCGALVVRWGACPRLCGRGLAALFGVGAVCRAPPPVSAVWFPAPLGWGLLVVRPLAVPFACALLFSVSLGAVSCPGLPGCGVWGGVLVAGSGPFPWCFPVGEPVLALPVRV